MKLINANNLIPTPSRSICFNKLKPLDNLNHNSKKKL